MLGTLVNSSVIVVCALAGAFFVRGIPIRFEELIKKAIGLSVVFVGLKGAFTTQNTLLLIMSLVLGAVLGEFINIDKWMNLAGTWIENRIKRGSSPKTSLPDSRPQPAANFSKAFVSASILFCSGAMAIVGPMESGLQGKHEMLFAKSVLDGSISLVFGASMGIGTAFSALPVLVYEGGIALAAMFVRDFLTEDIIREMSAAGSLVVAAIGFNFLAIKEIKVANLIPSVFIPLVYYAIMGAL